MVMEDFCNIGPRNDLSQNICGNFTVTRIDSYPPNKYLLSFIIFLKNLFFFKRDPFDFPNFESILFARLSRKSFFISILVPFSKKFTAKIAMISE